MPAVVWFVLALAAIALIGWVVSKRTGSHTWPLDEWRFDEGESIVWRDDAADVTLITRLAEARVTRPLRLHRWKVITTTTRMILATKSIGGKYLVMYVLHPGPTAGEDSRRIGGGLLTTGFQSLVVMPGNMTRNTVSGYVALQPDPSVPSSLNLAEVRIYTDELATFRLP